MHAGIVAAVLTLAGAVALCGAVAFIVVCRLKRQSYRGTVVQKMVSTSDDDGTDSYNLILSLDDGRPKSIALRRSLWETFAVGDTIVKRAGQLNPERA